MKRTPWVLVLLAGIFSGCQNQSSGSSKIDERPVASARLESVEAFEPHAKFGAQARLVMSGIEVPVQVSEERSAGDVRFILLAHGEKIESERYAFGKEGFLLLEAASESYEPGVPLLKFPMTVGESWDWKGSLVSGVKKHPATARVETKIDPLNQPGLPSEAVLAIVTLRIESGTPKPAEKKLSFWIAEKRGVVRREFGFAATREPLANEP